MAKLSRWERKLRNSYSVQKKLMLGGERIFLARGESSKENDGRFIHSGFFKTFVENTWCDDTVDVHWRKSVLMAYSLRAIFTEEWILNFLFLCSVANATTLFSRLLISDFQCCLLALSSHFSSGDEINWMVVDLFLVIWTWVIVVSGRTKVRKILGF